MENCIAKLIEAMAALGKGYGVTLWGNGEICIHRPSTLVSKWITKQELANALNAAIYKQGKGGP